MKTRHFSATRLSLPLASAIATLLTVHHAFAVTKTWVGGTADWNTAGNWNVSGVPVAADDAVFTSTGTTGIYLGDANRSIRSLTFNSTTGSTPYTINLSESAATPTVARVLSVGAGGIVVEAGSHTIKNATSSTVAGIGITSGSAINVAAGSTLNVEAKFSSIGGSSSTFSKTGDGTMVIKLSNAGSGSWNFSGGLFTVAAGTLELAVSNASGNSGNKYSVSSGGTLKLSASNAYNASTITLNGSGASGVGALYASATVSQGQSIVLATDSSIGVDASRTLTSTGVISGTGSAGLTKVGNGGLTLNGASTYSGATTVSAGTLTLGAAGSIVNSTTITVGASTTFNVSAVTGGYTLGAAQTLAGSGTVSGAMTVAGTLSPGSSPGILSTGSETWVNGGDYNFQMLNATGAAGTGFDQIQVTGTLDLTSLTAGGFAINLWSLSSTGPDVSGNALNFNNTLSQSWNILTTTGGITGFDAGDFLVNVGANNGTAGFSNALAGGSFTLDADANNLVLNFTPVPEARAALLGGLGLLALLRRRR
jgi:autotransporter-associated beta strand protein